MKKNVVIFGSNGMLGRYVKNYFNMRDEYNIVEMTRQTYDVESNNRKILRLLLNVSCRKRDIVINCVGLIPQRDTDNDYRKYFRVNTMFPYLLNSVCHELNLYFFHITTDCVFSGIAGQYNEHSPCSAKDIYGLSKYLGEPFDACIIRTSIIGQDKENKSLMSWLMSKNNGHVCGYVNHFWNGVTCLEVAKTIYKLLEDDDVWKGVVHLYSPKVYDKCRLLEAINHVYNLNVTIHKVEHENRIDRTLTSLFGGPKPSGILNQIYELKEFDDLYPIK